MCICHEVMRRVIEVFLENTVIMRLDLILSETEKTDSNGASIPGDAHTKKSH